MSDEQAKASAKTTKAVKKPINKKPVGKDNKKDGGRNSNG